MTLKVDGTNGVLQAYDAQTLTTGFSYTFASGTQTLIITPAGTLATGTITMPASPVDGMVITFESTQQITALTVAGNSGQTMTNGTMTLRPNQPISYAYRLSNTTWYPYAGATNSQIISGTSVASTSGTSIDFTGVPSWVKRVTVIFSGVSLSGTSGILIQVGSGSVSSSGYVSLGGRQAGSATSEGTSTAGFLINTANASALVAGSVSLVAISSTIWVESHSLGSTGSNATYVGGGTSPTLGGALDRVRITTVNGTDTFDAGSINILYE